VISTWTADVDTERAARADAAAALGVAFDMSWRAMVDATSSTAPPWSARYGVAYPVDALLGRYMRRTTASSSARASR
jgi:hypothetical protein